MQKNRVRYGAYGIMLCCLAIENSHAGGFAGGITTDNKINKNEPLLGTKEEAANGLLEAVSGYNINNSDFMTAAKLKAGGAIVAGITYNPAAPTDRSNYPLTFNDRSNEFQFNRFRLFLQREIDTTGSQWDVGGRFDFVTGADARYATSAGLDDKFSPEHRFTKIALPQFYLQVYAPFGRGITAQIGHFFTPIGSLSPFYSVSYTAYSEPSSHTGIQLSTPVSDHLTLSAGAILGSMNTLDNFGHNLEVWNFLGSASWIYQDTTVSAAIVTGDDTSDETINGIGKQRSNRTHASFVFNHNFFQKWHYKFQTDIGYQAIAVNAKPAHWYGIEQGLMYQVTNQLNAGIRAEWFKDQNGLKTMMDGIPATYYSISAGLFWKPLKWLTLRPELRYDVTNNPVFNDLTDRQQFTFATSFVIKL
ncbi:MAG: porin [Methylococcaceae bacterium]|nr:porin [Methylococcaceae bacterium]